MIPLNVTIEENLFTARGHRQVMRELLRNSMEYDRQTYLPLHFETVGYTRYPGIIKPRSKKWNDIKLRKVGHTKPNQFTGQLRERVLKFSIVRATSNQSTLTAQGYFPLTPERRRELEFISDREVTALSTRLAKIYSAMAKLPEYQEIRRVRRR